MRCPPRVLSVVMDAMIAAPVAGEQPGPV